MRNGNRLSRGGGGGGGGGGGRRRLLGHGAMAVRVNGNGKK